MFSLFFFFLLYIESIYSIDNGYTSPAMGYSTRYDLSAMGGLMNELDIKATAHALIKSGLAQKGYTIIQIDEGWIIGRSEITTNLIADPVRFPSGMQQLSQYIHSQCFMNNNGQNECLQLGLYSSRGTCQCNGPYYNGTIYPGSYNYYQHDINYMINECDANYIKFDSCCSSQNHSIAFQEYAEIRDLANNTNRKSFYSLCGSNRWYAPNGSSLGNSFRIQRDANYWNDIVDVIKTMASLANYTQIGGYCDGDILQSTTSYGQLTELQSRAQFAMYTLFTTPIMLGMRINNLTEWDLDTYGNTEAIDILLDLGRNKNNMYYLGGNVLFSDNNFTENSGIFIYGKALSDGGWG
eukprot:66978_1